MENIKLNTFENMCRTCMYTSDLIFIHDNNIIDILQYVSGNKYSKNDELPQKLCLKCLETMNQFKSFAFKCQQSHTNLTKYLNDLKLLNNKKINSDYTDKNIIKTEVIENTNNLELIARKNEIFEQMIVKETNEYEKFNQNNKTLNTDEVEVINVVQEDLVKEESIFEQITIKEEFKIEETINTSKNFEDNKANSNRTLNKKKRFKCNVCLKNFKYASHLTQHELIHTNERLYKCEVCNKSFLFKYGLVRHMTSHSEERPFECHVCMKNFKCTNSLIKHKKIHSDKLPYHCNICNETFAKYSCLNTHKTVHFDKRRLECDFCMKIFKQTVHLTEHRRIHTGERPYQCEVCHKSFTKKCHLVRHKVIHGKD